MSDDVKTEEVEEAAAKETAEGTQETPAKEEAKVEEKQEEAAKQAPDTGDLDWRSLLSDDEAKKQADRFNSLDEVFKSNAELRKAISDRIKLPGKDADEKEVAKFRKAIGVPESADGYEVSLPEGVELSEADQTLIDAVKPIAFEHNVPNAALGGFVAKFKEFQTQFEADYDAELKKQGEAAVDELRKEWGKEYDGNVNIANRAMKQFGGDEMVKFLNETETKAGGALGNHPQMVRLFAKLGRQMSEDGVIAPVDQDEAKDLNEKIEDLTKKIGEAHYKGDRDGAAKLMKEREALSSRLYGDEPIVGSGGRTS